MRIGLVTDTHYDPVLYPEKIGIAEETAAIFKNEGVSAVLGLGDMYEDFLNFDEAQTSILAYENAWAEVASISHWGVGSHEFQGISQAQYFSLSKFAKKNFVVDIGNYRILFYANADIDMAAEKYFYAPDDILAWLTAELAKCQTGGVDAGKKLIVCTHCWITKNYPGDPAEWTTEPYSVYSFNANTQRGILETALAAGADIKAVFVGHKHANSDITINGVRYIALADLGTDMSFAIITLADSGVSITGINNQMSYNRPLEFFASPSGDNTNQGYIRSLPWKTIAKVVSGGSSDGATTTLMPGVYRESGSLTLNGISTARITLNFEPGAIISGADIVTSFSLVGSEYQAALTASPNIVMKNGVKLTKGSAAGALTTGQWFWASSILYIKDDPTGHIIEAAQRASCLSFGTSAQYLTIHNPQLIGGNSYGIAISGAPISLVINNPKISNSYSGIDDNNTIATQGDLVINNPEILNSNTSGLYIRGASKTIVTNIKCSGNTNGIRVAGTASAKITGGLSKGNTTGIALETTGGAGTVIANVITQGNTTKGVNSTGAGVTEIKNSCIAEAANTWGTTTQTAIITADPKVLSTGMLRKDSPCIDTGVWVSGVGGNMSGELDSFDKGVYKLPNIGIDQGTGNEQKTKNIKHGGFLMGSAFSANSPTKNLAVSEVSGSMELPDTGNTLYIYNNGLSDCYVAIGETAITATLPGSTVASTATPIPAGSDRILAISSSANYISAVCAAGETTSIIVQVSYTS